MNGWVVYGSAAWDAPWLTEHNLAAALATGDRVLFVEPPVTPLTPFRYGLRPDTTAALRRLLRRGLRRAGPVHVLRTVALPPVSHAGAARASVPFLRRQVRAAARSLGLRRPVAVAARDMLAMRGAAGEGALVYLVKDWIEAGGGLLGRSAELLAAERRRMCAEADVVCATSPALTEALSRDRVQARLLPHGFAADLCDRYTSELRPPWIDELARPLLGFTGRIDARLDFEALAAVAKARSDATVLLVGPVSPRLTAGDRSRLHGLPNMVIRPAVPRSGLPPIVASLDCALLPYRDTEWIRRAAPLKLWDYLYGGAPIVGSGCDALRDLPQATARFVGPGGDWVAAVEAALEEGRRYADARRQVALANTWDQRAETLRALVGSPRRV